MDQRERQSRNLARGGRAGGAATSGMAARYALFFMFQNGITSGIATMSESVVR
jgi:hypothetical protein